MKMLYDIVYDRDLTEPILSIFLKRVWLLLDFFSANKFICYSFLTGRFSLIRSLIRKF